MEARQTFRSPEPSAPRAAGEQGGVVIIAALMLLMLLALATFGLSRTVLREVGISGNTYQGGRADAAADAGLDWFMAWENDSLNGNATPAAAAAAKTVTDKIASVYASGLKLDVGSSDLTWSANVGTPNGMVLQATHDDGSVAQSFNLRLVCMGKDEGAQIEGGETNRGNPSGSTNVRAGVQDYYLWETVSTGQALFPGDSWRFQSIRSAKVVIPPPPSSN